MISERAITFTNKGNDPVETVPTGEILFYVKDNHLKWKDDTQAVNTVLSTNTAYFTFDQPTPLSEWIINHNLGYFPNVAVFSLGGAEVDAEINHITINQARIYFSSPFAGSARLN